MNNTLEEKQALQTAQEILDQLTGWKDTLKAVREQNKEIREFLGPILEHENLDILFLGAEKEEQLINAVFPYMDQTKQVLPRASLLAHPGTGLDPHRTTLIVCFENLKPDVLEEAIGQADRICKGNVHYLCITEQKSGMLYELAKERDNAFAFVSGHPMEWSDQIVAVLLCFSADHLADVSIKAEDIIHRSRHFLDHGSDQIIDLVKSYDFDELAFIGMDTLHGLASQDKARFSSIVEGEIYDLSSEERKMLVVLFLSYNDAKEKQYELDLVRNLKEKGKTVLAVSAQHDEAVKDNVRYFVDLGVRFAKNNEFLPLAYLVVAQTLALFKAVELDEENEMALLGSAVRVCRCERKNK
ncbi:hypothetical protein AAK706_09140 [Erysipelotrichaceae bacterium 66-17]